MRKLKVLLLTLMVSASVNGQVVISEIMQSNIDCIMDDMNEFPDSWVEIYNGTSASINLSEYRLGESDDASEAWKLPDVRVNAGQYAVIYCDKEATGMHADFRLESGKNCEVHLFKGNAVIDCITGLKKQPAPNIAYGRMMKAEGLPSDQWTYFCSPTPGKANVAEAAVDILGEPVFDVDGGVYETKRNVKLTLSIPAGSPLGTHIRYTTDGTEPTADSKLYSTPITVSTPGVVRAKLFCKGWMSPRSTVLSVVRKKADAACSIYRD